MLEDTSITPQTCASHALLGAIAAQAQQFAQRVILSTPSTVRTLALRFVRATVKAVHTQQLATIVIQAIT